MLGHSRLLAQGLTGRPVQLLAVGGCIWAAWAFLSRIAVFDAFTGSLLRTLQGLPVQACLASPWRRWRHRVALLIMRITLAVKWLPCLRLVCLDARCCCKAAPLNATQPTGSTNES